MATIRHVRLLYGWNHAPSKCNERSNMIAAFGQCLILTKLFAACCLFVYHTSVWSYGIVRLRPDPLWWPLAAMMTRPTCLAGRSKSTTTPRWSPLSRPSWRTRERSCQCEAERCKVICLPVFNQRLWDPDSLQLSGSKTDQLDQASLLKQRPDRTQPLRSIFLYCSISSSLLTPYQALLPSLATKPHRQCAWWLEAVLAFAVHVRRVVRALLLLWSFVALRWAQALHQGQRIKTCYTPVKDRPPLWMTTM